MPMKNPPHVGQVIWHGVLEPLDLSITKAAQILGVRRATLSDLVNGRAALTAEMALRIHKAFGPDIGHLLRMQVAFEVAQVCKRAKEIKVKRYVAKAA
jgi:antitoxin HigA-1